MKLWADRGDVDETKEHSCYDNKFQLGITKERIGNEKEDDVGKGIKGMLLEWLVHFGDEVAETDERSDTYHYIA